MEIYGALPAELQNKIKYFVLEHPIAKIVKDDIERLRCNEHYSFKDEDGRFFCKIDGRDFYTNEYFRKFKKQMSIASYGSGSESETETSDEGFEDVFNRIFFVTSSMSDDD
jgi:hypothetical protein